MKNRFFLKKIRFWREICKGVPRTNFKEGENEKKFQGAKSHFLPKNNKFFKKLTFFPEKSVRQGGSCPLCPLGSPLTVYPLFCPEPDFPLCCTVEVLKHFKMN